jgi:hypothetical protein
MNGVYANRKGESMNDREKNLGVRIGDTIIHKNCEFIIVDIRCDEGMDGAELIIRAFDPHKADVEQQKRMKMEQTSNNFLDMFKKLSEGGGAEGLIRGFGIGG